MDELFGTHTVMSLDFYRFQPDHVAQQLHQVGLAVFARLLREPDVTEKVPQAYLLARKPATIGDARDQEVGLG